VATATTTGRGPGRPRDPAVDRAIIEAALAVLVDVGYDRLSVEEVARRAGVPKSTVYRRHNDKRALIAAAIDSIRSDYVTPDTGSLDGDIEALLAISLEQLAQPLVRRVTAMLVGAMAEDDDFQRIFWHNHAKPRREAFKAVLVKAQERGELTRDVDLDLVTDTITAVMSFQLVLRRSPDAARRVRESLDLVLSGLHPRAHDAG
jgi:AcrR family transcriptional regulator